MACAHHPFEWGTADCATLFADWVLSVTGYDPLSDVRGYKSAGEAIKALRQSGFRSCIDLVASRFVEIAPAHAHRGDLVFPVDAQNNLVSPAILDGVMAISKNEHGAVLLPRSAIARAFAV